MRFYSTRGNAPEVSAYEAICNGLAPDGGLYMPTSIPTIDPKALDPSLDYATCAEYVLSPYLEGDPLQDSLGQICRDAFSFPVTFGRLADEQWVLELFGGPTAAFKDFGARFLASFLERSHHLHGRDLTILVATSGDTGGAVASAFHGKEHIRVKVLFPEGRVSSRQQHQLTCWGGNISSYAVRGSFDDCQALVKRAFADESLSRRWGLSSANSINLGRLLPQSVYYVYAAVRFLEATGKKPVFVIPSGNVGNCVGAYLAKLSGAPIEKVILAVNSNTTIPDYLESGEYQKRQSIATIANAMDVGDPSNMERLDTLFPTIERLRSEVTAYSVSDQRIRETIGSTYARTGYILCPHTATAQYVREQTVDEDQASIIVATAHPAKFETIVEPEIGTAVPIPDSLSRLFDLKSSYRTIEPSLEELFLQ